MPRITLPANPYVSQFDFAATFDLTDGYLKIDLSPSVILNATGITGVTVSIQTPTGNTLSSSGYAFLSGTISSTYQVAIPKAIKVYLWGVYKITVSLTLGGVIYHNEKTFNLCAPDPSDIFKNEGKGTLTMKVDCQAGKVKVSGMSGYPYRGKLSSAEVRNITFFYPTESEITAQKSISVVPFEMAAYQGLSVVKAVLISTYIFDDNLIARLRYAATAELDVKCGLNMREIFCAVSALYENMYSCQGDAQREYTEALCRVNGLLWLIYVGQTEGMDITSHVTQLEQILNIDCSCSGCAGELVRPETSAICPAVSSVEANITGFVLSVAFNSTGISNVNSAQVEYRTKASAPSGPWTSLSTPVAITGAQQAININVAQITQYEVRVKTICLDGQSLAVTVDSNVPAAQNCVDVTQITGSFGAGAPPSTSTSTTSTSTTSTSTTSTSTTTTSSTTTSALQFGTNWQFSGNPLTRSQGGFTASVENADAELGIEFTALGDPGPSPGYMNILVNGVLQMITSFYSNYLGKTVRFTSLTGTKHVFTVIQGDHNIII